MTASSASYGSISLDGDMDASHTPAELDANDVFVIENGNLKVTTSRGNVYALEDGKVKGAGAKLNGSITAETKLFASQPENIVEFSYDHNGLRTQKKVTRADGIVETTDYVLHGKLLTHLTRGSDSLHFFYDEEKRPTMVEFNGTLYGYVHNLQGDIVGIVDSSGNLVVEYGYDAWGKPVVVRTLTTTYEALAELNPFRYRGYVWDEETELYYLRSRYSQPVWGRFLSQDAYLGSTTSLLVHNGYAYCKNRAVVRIDPSGHASMGLFAIIAVLLLIIQKDRHEGEPTSDVGAARPYREVQGVRESGDNTNCYAYALGITGQLNPGGLAGIPLDIMQVSDVYIVGTYVMLDAYAEGYTVRVISGPDAQVYEDEWKIALRVGTQPFATYNGIQLYDYHFMVQTDTGQWAEKHGPGGDSILWAEGETPETIPWTLNGVEYYDSEILYFAIGG